MKPFKLKRRFKFYQGKWPKGPRLFQYFYHLLVAAGEVVRSWDQGDLAEAVRNLDKTLKEIDGKMSVNRRQKIVLLVIDHRHGRNFYVCESQDIAIAQLHRFVGQYWNEMPETIGMLPMNREDAIEIYFEEKHGKESYEIMTLQVQSTKTP